MTRRFSSLILLGALLALTACGGIKTSNNRVISSHHDAARYLIMMAGELTEYWRNYMRSSTNASSTSSTAKSCWGTPSSSRSMLIVLTRYFE